MPTDKQTIEPLFLGVLLIWQIGLGKIPKASPKENGDNYSLAFNTRLDIVDR